MSQTTPKLSAKAKGLVTRAINGGANLTWKGSQHPDDWAHIERQAEQTRAKLEEYIAGLEATR